ncbi:MAG: hypothetical protein O8C63_11720 [Candidatus Methanoperedens sp.]|nr:hypothetical protein [Candidatus Methanoperedens sp.]
MSEIEMELQSLLAEYNALKSEQNRLYEVQYQYLTILISVASGAALGISYGIVSNVPKIFPIIIVVITVVLSSLVI